MISQPAIFRCHQAIEAPGPRLAYAEGLARAVLCKAGLEPLGITGRWEIPNCLVLTGTMEYWLMMVNHGINNGVNNEIICLVVWKHGIL
jgi:hypothetical protein